MPPAPRPPKPSQKAQSAYGAQRMRNPKAAKAAKSASDLKKAGDYFTAKDVKNATERAGVARERVAGARKAATAKTGLASMTGQEGKPVVSKTKKMDTMRSRTTNRGGKGGIGTRGSR